jgi:hypothetical protein
MKKVIEILVLPVAFMNIFSGIVGGIWLLILWEWRLLLIGLILTFTAHWYLSLILMLSTPFEIIAIKLYERNSKLSYLFSYFILLYYNILISASCIVAFIICTKFYDGEISISLVPYVLWAWAMALGPWRFLATYGGKPDSSTTIMIFSASILYLFFITSVFIGPIINLIAILFFVIVQLVALPLYLNFKKEKEF